MTLFLLTFIVVFTIPLLPCLVEVIAPTDLEPLVIVQQYDTDITHFANGFKVWLKKHFNELFIAQTNYSAENITGTLLNHTAYQIIGPGGVPSFSREEIYNKCTQNLIISSASIKLMEAMLHEGEIYSADKIQTAGHSQFRAMLAEGDITLGENCTVLRWIHSDASLYVAAGCNLYGRASAKQIITLSENCHFERLNAHKISFGTAPAMAEQSKADLVKLKDLPIVKSKYKRRWLIDGDFCVPARSSFNGDIVSSKIIHVGIGSHIIGNIKSNEDIYLAVGVRVDGSIVSGGNIYIGTNCHVGGPVISENIILIDKNSVIGDEDRPTTITASEIHVTTGVTAFGTVWADKSATVLPVVMANA
ncbi:MAG: hypothetical protein K2Q14_03475 [Gammaproteobacteria bacterium]|nr:hypothetical protein [Gammaproteobacteria bacterium]